nr:MAG TPA: hypothetical protein [Caudoviricetes sp.]
MVSSYANLVVKKSIVKFGLITMRRSLLFYTVYATCKILLSWRRSHSGQWTF